MNRGLLAPPANLTRRVLTNLARRTALCVLFLSLFPLTTSAAGQASPTPVFYVATNGNDQWSGTSPSPNWRKTDGPFATPARALQAARALKSQPTDSSARPATIFIRRGVYFLNAPLVLKPEDSGLTLAAYRDEQPLLSGGRPITGWKEVTLNGNQVWTATVPGAGEGQGYFYELWVNGRRATRARHPNRGYLPIAELPDKAASWTEGHTRFKYRDGDLKAWPTITNAEVVAMTRWVESRLPVVGIDESERLIRFGKRSVFELAPGDLYYIEGALELLDAPGEWCLLPSAGGAGDTSASSWTLYYAPRPGERRKNLEAIAPVLTQVLRFEADPAAGHFIDRVTLRGLTFAHTEWYFPPGFHSGKNKPTISPEPKPEVGGFAQAAVGVPGAVWGSGLRNCVFDRCLFHHLGNYGLELTGGCQANRIVGCEFADLGAGGLKLGETGIRATPSELTSGNEIADCRIHDGGQMFHSAIGIWIGQSPNNRITHNLIHDFYYTGISIGWTWGYGPALATNNAVTYNHVHHIGVKSDGDGPILSDMAGIYTLGKEPGTVILNNLWHDMAATRYGGWGIYFDEGSSGILAQSNVVYRTTHGGFHQHYGETNTVRNNIFAFARDHQIQRSRVEPHLSFTFETNIVYFDSGALLAGTWAGDQYLMDWNIYFDARPGASAGQLRFEKATLDDWRKRGHDLHSLFVDPRFAAPAQSNFKLQPGSPALTIGFQPIDLSTVGPRTSPQPAVVP